MSLERTGMGNADFPSTAWTMIVQAGGEGEESLKSLETICQLYWQPLYAFARRSGCSREDAMDRTQGFFAKLIEGRYLDRAKREKGKLRSFLLTCFKRYIRDEWRREQAAKRGGNDKLIPLDAESLEDTLSLDGNSPERLFERRWALAVLEAAMQRLQAEYVEKGKEEIYRELASFLTPDAAGESYQTVAEKLGITENAVGVAIYRLRKRFAELMRRQVIATLDSEEEVEGELRYLMDVLR
ncbi:MAG: sigma-70 family RNA polymerase sigma factor [Verrucomicrobiota bacterium JB023]|nr:sigma-70 family RNA polymerase sigma factor [Verrucomicrobiota bacterium JB023]